MKLEIYKNSINPTFSNHRFFSINSITIIES